MLRIENVCQEISSYSEAEKRSVLELISGDITLSGRVKEILNFLIVNAQFFASPSFLSDLPGNGPVHNPASRGARR